MAVAERVQYLIWMAEQYERQGDVASARACRQEAERVAAQVETGRG